MNDQFGESLTFDFHINFINTSSTVYKYNPRVAHVCCSNFARPLQGEEEHDCLGFRKELVCILTIERLADSESKKIGD